MVPPLSNFRYLPPTKGKTFQLSQFSITVVADYMSLSYEIVQDQMEQSARFRQINAENLHIRNDQK